MHISWLYFSSAAIPCDIMCYVLPWDKDFADKQLSPSLLKQTKKLTLVSRHEWKTKKQNMNEQIINKYQKDSIR